MSITDELREYIAEQQWCAKGTLSAIADRIDREHRMAMEKVAADADALPMTDESMVEHGWICLPLDADGVPIRVRDRLDGYGKVIEVMELRRGLSGWVIISREGNAYFDTDAFTHYHAPTVKDVLREFADEVQRCCDTQDTIAEFAARLRLAEEEK